MTVEKGLFTGLVADALLGDPRRGHPVAAFGHVATALERRVHRDSKVRGALFTATCVLGAAGLGMAADGLWRLIARGAVRHGERAGTPLVAARLGDTVGTLVTAAATWAVVGGTSLAREGRIMADVLEEGEISRARGRLPHLCGRDPSALDAKELARATVESIAENTSDAVVAPLVWGAAFGTPGLLAYRAINTLDAMVGHRSPRYANFGWAAARLDDAANWVPARLTGLLTAACAPLVGGSPRETYAILRRDGAAHPSPNAGRCEAAFAGALGVRLGGTNIYGKRVERRPELGDGRAPEPDDVRRAVRLSRAVTAATAIAVVGTRIVVGRVRGRPWNRSPATPVSGRAVIAPAARVSGRAVLASAARCRPAGPRVGGVRSSGVGRARMNVLLTSRGG